MTAMVVTNINRGRELVLWLFAGLTAVMLHGAVGVWLVMAAAAVEDESHTDGSALPIDLMAIAPAATEEVATRVDELRPELQASQASEAKPVEEPPPVEKSEVPLEPQQVEEDEVTLPKPTPVTEEKPPEEKVEETPEPQQQETVAANAQEAAAPAPVPAPPDPTPVTASQGLTPSQRRSHESWQKSLVMHLNRHKRYPDGARKTRTMGEAMVEFVMDRSGAVLSRKLVKGTGSTMLDAEAVEMLARAAPLPLPPVDVRGETFNLVVPVRFRLR